MLGVLFGFREFYSKDVNWSRRDRPKKGASSRHSPLFLPQRDYSVD